jgi:hypothetical protein
LRGESRNLISKLGLVGICLICLGLTGHVASLLLWSTSLQRYALWAKIRPVVAEGNIDFLFIGTSRVELGVDPVVFDQGVSLHRLGTNSYNIASAGESIVEMYSMLDRFFSVHPCCVKYVAIEPDLAAFGLVHAPTSVRAINFFDIQNAMKFLKYYREIQFQSNPILSTSQYTENIFEAALLHYSNLGLANFLIDADRHNVYDKLYDGDDKLRGFQPYDTSLADEFVHNAGARARYQDALSSMNPSIDNSLENQNLVSNYQVHLVSEIASLVRRHHANLIFLRLPQVAYWNLSESFIIRLRGSCNAIPAFLDFGYPAENPILFDAANRFDEDHLNRRGATIFSKLLADRIALILADAETPITRPEMSCEDH